MLQQERLEQLMQDCHWGHPVRVVPEIGSTNTALLESASERVEGEVLIAERQTAGRGQQQRVWWNGAGDNLAMSVFLRPRCSPADLPSFALLASLVAKRAIRQVSGWAAQIKWPNDLVASGRKIGGVLCEAKIMGGCVDCLVIGMGINVNCTSFPPELAETASSIRCQSGQKIDRGHLVAQIVRELEQMTPLWLDRAERIALLAEYTSSSAVVGREIEWKKSEGELAQRGMVLGFEPDGALRLLDEQGKVHCYRAGEVRIASLR
jgi:birA, biotin-[acetyl-CoA-carboxylase] ligase region